jgi:hypothetical protein
VIRHFLSYLLSRICIVEYYTKSLLLFSTQPIGTLEVGGKTNVKSGKVKYILLIFIIFYVLLTSKVLRQMNSWRIDVFFYNFELVTCFFEQVPPRGGPILTIWRERKPITDLNQPGLNSIYIIRNQKTIIYFEIKCCSSLNMIKLTSNE